MTPLDVIKTRIATKTVASNLSILSVARIIIEENGVRGLYAGARARMVWSGAFSAIGFGTFEAAKKIMGIALEEEQRKSSLT